MTFFTRFLKKGDTPIKTYTDFWNWFQENEKYFFQVLKNQGDIEKVFFNKLSPKLDELKDGFWFLTGMYNDNTAELILTADGIIKNIVFVEELVAAAPKMNSWKFTALKPSSELNKYGIEMEGYKFDETTMSFFSVNHSDMPDEIDITMTHKDYNEDNKELITNGVYISIDNYLGELKSITTIDNLNIINPNSTDCELIPLEKLKDFLLWREKEFIEKYKGLRHNTDTDSYNSYEMKLNNGSPIIAIINSDILNWDKKASHPWIMTIKIKYNGEQNNGLPSNNDYILLDKIEDEIINKLKDIDGYLNIGRETGDSLREIYFACVDFRVPSKTLQNIKQSYKNQLTVEYNIYKDKYWQSFNRYANN